MANAPHVKKGDMVYILAGKDRQSRLTDLNEEQRGRLDHAALRAEVDKRSGKRGKVLQVLADRERVLVENINMVTKHARPRGQVGRRGQMQAGRMEQPGPIHISNVMLVCPRCDRPTKVIYRPVHAAGGGASETGKEKRIRACRRCNEYIDEF